MTVPAIPAIPRPKQMPPHMMGVVGGNHIKARAYNARGWADTQQSLGCDVAALPECLHNHRRKALPDMDGFIPLPRDLRDMAANAGERDYIRREAAAAVTFIEEAVRIAASAAEYHCQRCSARVTAEEYARSNQAFQRIFCDRCFDEVFLERRSFETQVEINKTIEARDGTVVQSEGERRIADWLTASGIAYRYDAKFRIVGEFQIRPDFYLPELDVYIEYWGLDTPQYKMSMYKKQTLYQQEGKRLISVYPVDLPRLGPLLAAKLRRFGYDVGADARSEVSPG